MCNIENEKVITLTEEEMGECEEGVRKDPSMAKYSSYNKLTGHDKYIHSLLKYLGVFDLINDLHILDLGCGSGMVYNELKKEGFRNVSACDINKTFEDVKVFDFEKRFNYPSDSFDLIICFDVIEHIKDNLHFISEIHRILKPGGEVIILTGAAEDFSVFYTSFTHYHPYTKASLNEGLKLFFRASKVEYFKAIPILWRFGCFINTGLKYNLLGRAIK